MLDLVWKVKAYQLPCCIGNAESEKGSDSEADYPTLAFPDQLEQLLAPERDQDGDDGEM